MRWAWWVGSLAVSLVLGATLLMQRSPPETLRAPSHAATRQRVTDARTVMERAAPLFPQLPPVISTPEAASAPALVSAIPPDATSASAPFEVAAIAERATPAAVSSLGPLVGPAKSERVIGPRRVSIAGLAAWSKPGLCSTSEEAEATRDKLTASFRRLDDDERGPIYFDPRLPEGAESALLPLFEQARAVIERQLGLQPQVPPTFVYLDQQLLKAAACINEDVVAFYDGALHLVANRSDLQQSVTHELTHHALFGSGLIGPAWAQEGIAMLVAQETWWRAPAQLQTLLHMPFSPEQMAELIPYKLASEQALVFYVQSALTVQCLLTRHGWSLQELAETLRNGGSPGSVSYDLPELESDSFVSSCAAALAAP